MIRLWKPFAIAFLVLTTLAPMASARKKKIIIYYQTSASPVWYEVYTEKQAAAPVYTYTVPASSDKIYVYSAPEPPMKDLGQVKVEVPGPDTSIFIDGQFVGVSANVLKVAVEPGSHDVELRDADGKSIFTGNLDVNAGATTDLKPDLK